MTQAILSGLIIGSIYALIALGYYITHLATKTLNFGQGDTLMIGAIIGLSVFTSLKTFGMATLWAFLLTILAVIMAQVIIGYLIEQIAIKPLKNFDSISWILSTVALSIIGRNIAEVTWGKTVQPFPSPFGSNIIRFGEVSIYPHEIFVLISTFVIIMTLFLMLRKSVFGKALQAVAFNRDAASLMGINPRLLAIIAFVISTVLAGIGGIMIGPITNVAPFLGLALGLKAFAAAIIGGLDNPMGILIGGLSIGVIEQVVALQNSALKDFSVYFLILVVLIVLPQGLMGKKVKEKY
jgi:branched-chain amino acid transport system permease protein